MRTGLEVVLGSVSYWACPLFSVTFCQPLKYSKLVIVPPQIIFLIQLPFYPQKQRSTWLLPAGSQHIKRPHVQEGETQVFHQQGCTNIESQGEGGKRGDTICWLYCKLLRALWKSGIKITNYERSMLSKMTEYGMGSNLWVAANSLANFLQLCGLSVLERHSS